MKTIVILSVIIIGANYVFADPNAAALNLAQKVAQTSVATAPAQTTQPPAVQPAPATPNPQLEATLQNISNLRLDFDNLGKLTPTNPIAPVRNSLMTNLFIAAHDTKPSEATTARLADHLVNAIAGRDILSDQHTKLAQNVHALFNGSHLTAEQQETLLSEVQQILQTGGVTTDLSLIVVNDLRAIANETSSK